MWGRLAFGAAVAMLVLPTVGCGHDPAPADVTDGPRIEFTRVESVIRDGAAPDDRSTTFVDYARNRSEWVDETSGCRTVRIGDVAYWQATPDEGLPSGKRWVRSAPSPEFTEAMFEQMLDEQSAAGVVTPRILIGVEQPDPFEYLDELRGHPGELLRVGEDEINGTPAVHYSTTVDRAQQARSELEREGWKAENIDRYAAQIGSREDQIDVWIDPDGVVRRVVFTLEPGVGGFESYTTTLDYLALDEPVRIEAPPLAEVIDEDEWVRHQGAVREETEAESGAPPTCLH